MTGRQEITYHRSSGTLKIIHHQTYLEIVLGKYCIRVWSSSDVNFDVDMTHWTTHDDDIGRAAEAHLGERTAGRTVITKAP